MLVLVMVMMTMTVTMVVMAFIYPMCLLLSIEAAGIAVSTKAT